MGLRFCWALLALLPVLSARAQTAPATLRIGMQDEPDVLDPARGGTFAGRLVFAAACDKLLDTNPALDFVPQLATGWTWSADGLTLTLELRGMRSSAYRGLCGACGYVERPGLGGTGSLVVLRS